MFEAVAVAFEGDDLGVVDEPVDHGGGDDLVPEHLAPPSEGLVAGDDERGAFVAAAVELEEQVRRLGLERDVADLVELCRDPHRSTSSGIAPLDSNGSQLLFRCRRRRLRAPQPRNRQSLALRGMGPLPTRPQHRGQPARPAAAPQQRRRHRRRELPDARSPQPDRRPPQEALTPSRGWGLFMATSGDFQMAIDRGRSTTRCRRPRSFESPSRAYPLCSAEPVGAGVLVRSPGVTARDGSCDLSDGVATSYRPGCAPKVGPGGEIWAGRAPISSPLTDVY